MNSAGRDWAFDAAGWLHGANVQHRPSPHQDERPADTAITLAVVHNISLPPGQFGGGHIEALFDGRLDPAADPYFAGIAALRVSAHFLIDRAGRITQFVACGQRAWHAGASSFQGRERCNDFSIGIELEGTDDRAFEPAQYAALARLLGLLAAAYPLSAVAGHSDIAPGRKTDPGPCFEWPRLRAALAGSPALHFPFA